MGTFLITIQATGGHGCQRDKGDGSLLDLCGDPRCPDCMARACLTQLKGIGCAIESATLTHWPGTPQQVVDDLKTGVRHGSFTGGKAYPVKSPRGTTKFEPPASLPGD
jgi:hypothetical protein